MNDGIINLDSARGTALGFTSDRFGSGSYLWKVGNAIYVSFIVSLARGNFRDLVERIQDMGLAVEVPTPLARMEEIVRKNGYRYERRWCAEMGDHVDVWILDAKPARTDIATGATTNDPAR